MTVAVSLCPTAGAFAQFFTTGGLPLNAGLLYQYIAGGTTPQATYTTSAGSVQNANPIVLGADGRPPNEIWLVNGSAYRFDLYDSASNLIATYDNIQGIEPSISGTYLPTSGGTMTGNIAMGGNKVTGLAAASAAGDAVRYEQSPAAILTAKGSIISASGANTPAVVAVGSDGRALVANSNNANGVNWANPALRGYLNNCVLFTAGGSGTMNINQGVAVDSTFVSAMVLSNSINKTTSAWAVGNNNGGLDTGSIANATWYHFFAIQRVDTGVVDVLFSLQPSAPTMPTNYTLKRRVGSGLTDGSAHWTLFTQYGDIFELATPVIESTGATPGTNAVTQTLANVPTGVNVRAMLNIANDGTAGLYCYLSDLATTDLAPSASAAPLFTVGQAAASIIGNTTQVMTNTSAQIRTRNATNNQLRICTLGWIDRRGQDA